MQLGKLTVYTLFFLVTLQSSLASVFIDPTCSITGEGTSSITAVEKTKKGFFLKRWEFNNLFCFGKVSQQTRSKLPLTPIKDSVMTHALGKEFVVSITKDPSSLVIARRSFLEHRETKDYLESQDEKEFLAKQEEREKTFIASVFIEPTCSITSEGTSFITAVERTKKGFYLKRWTFNNPLCFGKVIQQTRSKLPLTPIKDSVMTHALGKEFVVSITKDPSSLVIARRSFLEDRESKHFFESKDEKDFLAKQEKRGKVSIFVAPTCHRTKDGKSYVIALQYVKPNLRVHKFFFKGLSCSGVIQKVTKEDKAIYAKKSPLFTHQVFSEYFLRIKGDKLTHVTPSDFSPLPKEALQKLPIQELLTDKRQLRQFAVSSPKIKLDPKIDYKINPNVAGVLWVTYNDRDDFKKAPKLARKFFCVNFSDGKFNPASTFRISQDKYFPVPIDAKLKDDERLSLDKPRSFEEHIAKALSKLEKSKSPNLVISIDAHGGKGVLCRQSEPNVTHNKLVDVIFAQIDQHRKRTGIDPVLWLFYDACHSATLIDEVKKKSEGKDGRYENGSGKKYRYKVVVLAASDRERLGYGNNMWNHALKLKSRPTASGPHIDWKAFCSGEEENTHNYFNSFSPKLFKEALKSSQGRKPIEINEGLRLLRNLEKKHSPEETKAILDKIPTFKNPEIAAEALSSLYHLNPKDPRIQKAILEQYRKIVDPPKSFIAYDGWKDIRLFNTLLPVIEKYSELSPQMIKKLVKDFAITAHFHGYTWLFAYQNALRDVHKAISRILSKHFKKSLSDLISEYMKKETKVRGKKRIAEFIAEHTKASPNLITLLLEKSKTDETYKTLLKTRLPKIKSMDKLNLIVRTTILEEKDKKLKREALVDTLFDSWNESKEGLRTVVAGSQSIGMRRRAFSLLKDMGISKEESLKLLPKVLAGDYSDKHYLRAVLDRFDEKEKNGAKLQKWVEQQKKFEDKYKGVREALEHSVEVPYYGQANSVKRGKHRYLQLWSVYPAPKKVGNPDQIIGEFKIVPTKDKTRFQIVSGKEKPLGDVIQKGKTWQLENLCDGKYEKNCEFRSKYVGGKLGTKRVILVSDE